MVQFSALVKRSQNVIIAMQKKQFYHNQLTKVMGYAGISNLIGCGWLYRRVQDVLVQALLKLY